MAYRLEFIIKESQGRGSGRDWRQGPTKEDRWGVGGGHDTLLAGLLLMFLYTSPDGRPGMAPLTGDWSLPHQSVIKKMPMDLSPGKCGGGISQLRFLLPW